MATRTNRPLTPANRRQRRHPADIDDLPAALTDQQAAPLLGISRWTLGDLDRQGRPPVQPIRLGRLRRWPKASILKLLDIDGNGG